MQHKQTQPHLRHWGKTFHCLLQLFYRGEDAPASCPKETCIIHVAITLRSILPRIILWKTQTWWGLGSSPCNVIHHNNFKKHQEFRKKNNHFAQKSPETIQDRSDPAATANRQGTTVPHAKKHKVSCFLPSPINHFPSLPPPPPVVSSPHCASLPHHNIFFIIYNFTKKIYYINIFVYIINLWNKSIKIYTQIRI